MDMTAKLFECDRDEMYSYILRLCSKFLVLSLKFLCVCSLFCHNILPFRLVCVCVCMLGWDSKWAQSGVTAEDMM